MSKVFFTLSSPFANIILLYKWTKLRLLPIVCTSKPQSAHLLLPLPLPSHLPLYTRSRLSILPFSSSHHLPPSTRNSSILSALSVYILFLPPPLYFSPSLTTHLLPLYTRNSSSLSALSPPLIYSLSLASTTCPFSPSADTCALVEGGPPRFSKEVAKRPLG